MPDKTAADVPLQPPQRMTPSGRIVPTDATETEIEESLLETQSKPMGCWMAIGLLILLALAFWLITIISR